MAGIVDIINQMKAAKFKIGEEVVYDRDGFFITGNIKNECSGKNDLFRSYNVNTRNYGPVIFFAPTLKKHQPGKDI